MDPLAESVEVSASHLGMAFDPRVIDLYESDVTIAPALEELPEDEDRAREHVDRAVVELLSEG